MSAEEIITEIKVAMIALGDFWEIDEESQQRTLDTASKCMRAVLMMFGGKEGA